MEVGAAHLVGCVCCTSASLELNAENMVSSAGLSREAPGIMCLKNVSYRSVSTADSLAESPPASTGSSAHSGRAQALPLITSVAEDISFPATVFGLSLNRQSFRWLVVKHHVLFLQFLKTYFVYLLEGRYAGDTVIQAQTVKRY